MHSKVVLAPMAGCTDLAFRLIAREQGAEFCFYEMIDANSLHQNALKKSLDILETNPLDLPIAAQLLGADPEIMLNAAKRVLDYNRKISFLDINAACPVKKVIKKKSGAYLVHDPEPLYRIIDRLSSSLKIPITVKLRTGFVKRDPDRIAGIAGKCEAAGAKTLFVHGRTKAQEYSGEIDYESIKAIKQNVKIPVFGSGNIFSGPKAAEMIKKTKCDGVMAARGALGNPWIFKEIKLYLEDEIVMPAIPVKEKLEVAKKHIQYIEKFKKLPAKSKLGVARKTAAWYLKGFRHAAEARAKAYRAGSFGELYGFIDTISCNSLINSFQ